MKIARLLMMSILLVSIASVTSCKKDNPAPKTDNNGGNGGSGSSSTPVYELRFTCTSDNPYLIEVAGNSNIVQGHSYKIYNLDQGTYAWKVTQQSGYAFYPTVKSGTVTLNQDKEIVFP